jgi:hypothetical protein
LFSLNLNTYEKHLIVGARFGVIFFRNNQFTGKKAIKFVSLKELFNSFSNTGLFQKRTVNLVVPPMHKSRGSGIRESKGIWKNILTHLDNQNIWRVPEQQNSVLTTSDERPAYARKNRRLSAFYQQQRTMRVYNRYISVSLPVTGAQRTSSTTSGSISQVWQQQPERSAGENAQTTQYRSQAYGIGSRQGWLTFEGEVSETEADTK